MAGAVVCPSGEQLVGERHVALCFARFVAADVPGGRLHRGERRGLAGQARQRPARLAQGRHRRGVMAAVELDLRFTQRRGGGVVVDDRAQARRVSPTGVMEPLRDRHIGASR